VVNKRVQDPVGRTREIAQMARFLDRTSEKPTVLLVHGEAGIGKTTMLRHAAALTANRSVRLLSAAPSESEIPLEFSTLADLLESVPETAIAELPSPQRTAIEVAIRRSATSVDPIDPRTIATALLGIFRSLASVGAVLLVIDDLPWADAPSARAIGYALRRVKSVPVSLLATARTEWPSADVRAMLPMLDSIDVELQALGPLGIGGARALVAQHAPSVVKVAQVRRIHQSAAGNPLLVIEMAAELAAKSNNDVTQSTGRSLRATMLERVRALTAAEVSTLLVAALCESPTVTLVASAVDDPVHAQDALRSATRRRLIAITGDSITFAHPLIRSTIVEDADDEERRDARQRLAQVVATMEERARLLALASIGPDESIAAKLQEAALSAGARGACETAAELASLAVALTPHQESANRLERILLEAEYRFDSSEPAAALELMQDATKVMENGPQRAEALRRLARYEFYVGGNVLAWVAALDDARSQVGGDKVTHAKILLDLQLASNHGGDLASAQRYGEDALGLAEEIRDEELQAQALALTAWVRFCAGKGVSTDLIDRIDPGYSSPVRVAVEIRPNVLLGHVLHLSDDLDGARKRYESELTRASAEGLDTAIPVLLSGLIETEAFAGRWDRADELTAEGWRLAEESGGRPSIAFMLGARGLMNAYRGRVSDAVRDASLSAEIFAEQGVEWAMPLGLQPIGPALLSTGDFEGAHRGLGVVTAIARGQEFLEPGLLRPVLDDVEALIRLGKKDEASAIIDAFEPRARELERTSALAGALRCRALLFVNTGKPEDALELVAESLDLYRGLALPFDLARALLTAGEVYRRSRRKTLAFSHFEQSAKQFSMLGSPIWEAHALSEMERVMQSGGARTLNRLSPSELRVAELVASGLSNAQVAEQLFMGRRTVESHLTHIYAKLGVSTRTEMSRTLQQRSIHQDL
jgi:DNA-binding CsgD family transcriptional regulator